MYVMCYECVFRVNFVMFRPCKYNMKSDSLKVNKVFRWCAHHIYSLASGFEEKSGAVGSKTISTCSSFINIRKTTYSTYKLMHVQLVLSLIIILTQSKSHFQECASKWGDDKLDCTLEIMTSIINNL